MLACSFMKEAKPYIEEGVHPQVIVRAYRQAAAYALAQIKDIAIKVDKADPKEMRELLEKCAATTLCSKLVATQKVGALTMRFQNLRALTLAQANRLLGVCSIQQVGQRNTEVWDVCAALLSSLVHLAHTPSLCSSMRCTLEHARDVLCSVHLAHRFLHLSGILLEALRGCCHEPGRPAPPQHDWHEEGDGRSPRGV